ncbi:hypothetical protein B5E65_12245 [Gemmiger sp. An120]|uniref:hypothetical protein n=1 Tax=Gemmiger sp. An120 TaxID=1965549 RepID=UPI000B380B30|nr:hypothetical protein [Gemmiger sp. An120]OUQ41399.1 hypothetical protein B5E65_12245 [Gemmiger sp. An120]
MTKYICKCGRVVTKNTTADNTGNRDTAGCEGCPYLLPWGPMVWDDQQKGYTQDVKGYECRMSPTLEYASTYHGRADDKCSLHIVSLDLDFLDEVQAWIYDHANETLRADFSRGSMRGIEFYDKGRYSLSVLCAQNKKGVAAKAALLAEFFGPDKHRRDMTPEEEKAHILAAIEAGKTRAQRKENTMVYKDPSTGWMYRVSPKAGQDGCFCIEYIDPVSSAEWKPWPAEAKTKATISETIAEVLEARAKQNGWEPTEEKEWNKNAKNAQRVGAAVTTETSATANDVASPAIVMQTSAEKSPAPASPADAGAATQSLSAAEPASLEARPLDSLAFDFGADAETNAALLADAQVFMAGSMARVMAAKRAHDRTASNYRGSWGKWCELVGISRDTGDNMVRVAEQFGNIQYDGKNLIEVQPLTLLYDASRATTPPEIKAKVESLDITTHKQYREAMAALKERDAKIQELLEMSEAADRRADEAQAWAKKAESDAREAQKERDGARDALQAAKRRGDQWQEKAEARQARLQELENRPIQAAAVDSDEVDRMVTQRLEEELAKQMPRQQEEQEQAARDAYDAFILTARSLDNLWRTLKPQIARLAPDQKNGAKNLLLQKLMEVKEELIHACEDHQP